MKPGTPNDSGDCRAVADVLARIGDKWTVYIVRLLSDGPKRFNEIRRSVTAISQRMLSDRKSTRLNSSHIQKSRMPSSA